MVEDNFHWNFNKIKERKRQRKSKWWLFIKYWHLGSTIKTSSVNLICFSLFFAHLPQCLFIKAHLFLCVPYPFLIDLWRVLNFNSTAAHTSLRCVRDVGNINKLFHKNYQNISTNDEQSRTNLLITILTLPEFEIYL